MIGYRPRRGPGWFRRPDGVLVRCRRPHVSDDARWVVRVFLPEQELSMGGSWFIVSYPEALTWKRVPPSKVPLDLLAQAHRAGLARMQNARATPISVEWVGTPGQDADP